MEQTTKTRKLAEILDEAERRSAALVGLADVVSDLANDEGTTVITANSSKETFDLANGNLNNYRNISAVSLSLLTLANDVYELISKAGMDKLMVADGALMKRLTDILDNVFNAGYQYATDAANGVDVDGEKLDQDMAVKQNELLALFGVREAR